MGEFRMLKLGEQIRDEISKLIMLQKVKDPRVSTFLTINRVEVARDLAYAKVYVSSFLNESQVKKGVEGLNSAALFSLQSPKNSRFINSQSSLLSLTRASKKASTW